MADRFQVRYQGRVVMRRGLLREHAEREAETLAKGLRHSTDHLEVVKDKGFEREDNESYRRYRQGDGQA